MSKRILDGEALWHSDKLAQVEPAPYRAEYANLHPLALGNGSFECNPRAVWATVYSFNRPDITPEDVVKILDEFERVRLLFRWTKDGKVWGYWTGSEKPGRLPPPSRLAGTHERLGEVPPPEQLAAFLASGSSRPDTQRLAGAYPERSSGSGYGSGLGIDKTQNTEPQSEMNLCKSHNSQPEQQNLEHHNSELPSPDELKELFVGPETLCGLFESELLRTNTLRKGKKADPRPDHWRKTWVADFQQLLDSGYSVSDVEKMIKLSFGRRWLAFTFRPKNIVDNHDKLAADLGIPVRELAATPTAYERRVARAKAMREAAVEKARDGMDDEFDDIPNCQGGCGTGLTEPGYCSECQEKATRGEFARLTGARPVSEN